MNGGGSPDFGLDYFSLIGREFQERKSKIREQTICFKVCSKCGEIKPVYKFPVEKRNTDGRLGTCKVCRNKEALKYYYKNKSEILAKCKKYRATHKRDRTKYIKDYQEKHKERLKELASKWYSENKEAIKKRNLKYYQANKEDCRQRRKLWIEKNRERIRKYNREYKQKLKAVN